jgi:hypothetical protein
LLWGNNWAESASRRGQKLISSSQMPVIRHMSCAAGGCAGL